MQDKLNVRLYNDVGQAIRNQTSRDVEMTKKKLCKTFKEKNAGREKKDISSTLQVRSVRVQTI